MCNIPTVDSKLKVLVLLIKYYKNSVINSIENK